MRIGIDARFYSESGVGRYLRNLISNLMVSDKKNEYFIFLLPKDFDEFENSKNFQKVKTECSWYGFAEQFNLPKLLKQYNLDLVHFPHFNVPIFYTGKFVVTIHDLIHQHHAMTRATTLNPFTFKIKQFGYRKVFKTAVTKSLKVLVPSESVKKLLVDEWNVGTEKIIVTHEAVDNEILSINEKIAGKNIEKVLQKFKINGDFIFYVGNAHPHKNVDGLIKAFLILKQRYPNLKLVLSGYDHYFWERVRKESNDPSIIYTGFVSDEELVALFKSARLFVLPSFEEGFGIPVLEAMACGCPVVCSNTSSLPEVAGNAAIFFDPSDQKDLINKISKVLDDEDYKKSLISKGKKRVKLFNWKRLAEQTLEVYKKCVLP